MRLRYIEAVDFRKSEYHNFMDIQKRAKLDLSKDDCILLISHGGNQLIFVYGFANLQNGYSGRQVLRSERYRLLRGTWEPMMLADYAEQVGIKLEGIKKFEEHYKHLVENHH